MDVERLLHILPKAQLLRIQSEDGELLFKGKIWQFDSKYIRSCLVTDVYCDGFYVVIVVVG